MSDTLWVSSRHSKGEGGNCLEWAPGTVPVVHAVPVRDSKSPDRPAMLVPVGSWSAFVGAVRGERLTG